MSTIIAGGEIVAIICCATACVLAAWVLRPLRRGRAFTALAAAVCLLLLISIAILIRRLGPAGSPGALADYAEFAIPVVWLLLIYALINRRADAGARVYRRLFERAGVGIAVIDQEGMIRAANPEFGRIVGVRPERLEDGESFRKFVSEWDTERVGEYLRRARANGAAPETVAITITDVDSRPHAALLTAAMVPKRGELLCTVQDITYVDELRGETDTLTGFRAAVMHSATAWIMIVDNDRRITFWNHGAERITGYSAAEIMADPHAWETLYPEDDGAPGAPVPGLSIGARGGDVRSFRTVVTTRDGTRKAISWEANVIRDADHGVAGVLAVGHDLTRSYEAERDMERLAEEQHLLLDNVPVMIFWKDAESRFLRVNKAFAASVNMAPEDIVGKTTAEVCGRRAERYNTDDHQVLSTGEPKLAIVEPVMTPRGERWHRTDKIPLLNSEGSIVGIVGFTVDITAQRQAYDALAASEREAAALASFREHVMQTANVWIAVADNETTITLWNAEAEKISGYSAEEIIGRDDVWRLLYPDDADHNAVMTRVRALLATEGDSVTAETIVRCKDGKRKNISWHTARLSAPTGECMGMIAIGTDVSATKETERRQAAGLRVLQALNDTSDSRGMIASILGIVKEFTGCERAAVRLRQEHDFPYFASEGVDPDGLQSCMSVLAYGGHGRVQTDAGGAPRLRAPYGVLLGEGCPPPSEHLTKAGSFWVNDLGALPAGGSPVGRRAVCTACAVAAGSEALAMIPLRSAGTVVGLLELGTSASGRLSAGLVEFLEELGSSIGIAVQRRLSEDLLRRERDFSRSVVHNAQALIIGLDRDGNISLFNTIAEDTTGYRASEAIGRKPWFLLSTDDNAVEFARPFKRMLAGDYPKVFELRSRCKDGRERLITWRGTALTDARGEVWQVVAIGLDITSHRQLEAQIRQSQRMEAITTLAGGIAHDFNNVLHAVLSNVELIGMLGQLSERQQTHAHAIEEAVRHAASITKQLTEMSSPRQAEKGNVDINQCVDSVLSFIQGARDQRVEVVTSLQETLPPVLGDPTQIEQVLMNLCVNALQALEHGGRLEIVTRLATIPPNTAELKPDLTPGARYVRLTVTDTGSGMPTETLERIFDPFFTTREDKGGTGLGLAIAYGIVHAHGGSITAESEIGRGTTFTVYLPEAEEPTSAPPSLESHLETGSETIMLVDDNDAVRANLRQLLASLGYTVIEANTGAEAVAACHNGVGGIDLFMLDINMPEIDGIEAFGQVRSIIPEARGILITGFVSDGVDVQQLPEGIMGVMRKPFTIRQLSRCVRLALTGSRLDDLQT